MEDTVKTQDAYRTQEEIKKMNKLKKEMEEDIREITEFTNEIRPYANYNTNVFPEILYNPKNLINTLIYVADRYEYRDDLIEDIYILFRADFKKYSPTQDEVLDLVYKLDTVCECMTDLLYGDYEEFVYWFIKIEERRKIR